MYGIKNGFKGETKTNISMSYWTGDINSNREVSDKDVQGKKFSR